MSEAWKDTYWSDRPPKRRATRKCIDCPAVFEVNGPKERCSACSDINRVRRKSEREKQKRAAK